jgi:HK97 family phage major capsid protein
MASTTDNQIRSRLKAIRDDMSAARDRRAEAKKERDAAKEAFVGVEVTGRKLTEVPEFLAAEQAVKKLGEIDDEINDLKGSEASILQLLGESLPESNGSNGDHARHMPAVTRSWNGHDLLKHSEDFNRAREMGIFHSRNQFGTVNFGEIASREDAARFLAAGTPPLPAAPGVDISTAGTGMYVAPDYRGVVPPLLRPLNLLDLIPSGTTDSNIIEYVQVTAIPGTAAPVPELALKPQEGLTAQEATAPVRTIAGYIKASRQSLDDVAGLATLINTLLPYDVRRTIEAQMLMGDGTGQNLTGIFHTTGVGAPTFVTGDNVADAVLRAMTVIILSFSEPNFIALNPLTWQDLMLMRTDIGGAGTGSYMYGGPGYLNQPPTLWGLPMTKSVVIPQATPLVGDAMGATLMVREGVNVKTSDSDQDDFIRNRVTILAEARVAFPVWRPSAFCIAATA